MVRLTLNPSTKKTSIRSDDRKLRLGIFGGTFDPPHIGHLILADEARFQLDLDTILWVLTPSPPHKGNRSISSLELRLTLLKAAIQDQPHFSLSTVDIDRSPPHYAVDTVRLIARQFPGAIMCYLVGGDSLHDLPKWHLPQDFLAQCSTLGVMRRPGDQVDLPSLEGELPGISERVHWIHAPLMEISATNIREKIRSGQSFQYYLHPAVYQLICAKRYYQEDK